MRSSYIDRVVDTELDRLLPHLAAVLLDGPKAVGKTRTAERRTVTQRRLDQAASSAAVRADPSIIASDDPPVLIDEWHHVPAVWDAVRRAVDAGAQPGSFILTGSAPTGATHTGAGRIHTVRMRPFTFAERGLETPTVSLADLLAGTRPAIGGQTSVGLTDYIRQIVVGGYPGLRGLPDAPRTVAIDGYIDRIVERDMPDAGYRVNRPETLRGWLTAYAAATATTASFAKIRDAAVAGTPAKATVQAYTDTLTALRILDPVPAWAPTGNQLRRVATSPKHHLADPALAARLLRLSPRTLITGAPPMPIERNSTILGGLIESLATLSIRTYAQAAGAATHHFRDRNGRHEIDLVIVADEGIVPLEIKTANAARTDDFTHIDWITELLGTNVIDSILVTTGPEAYRAANGTAVVPLALLGP